MIFVAGNVTIQIESMNGTWETACRWRFSGFGFCCALLISTQHPGAVTEMSEKGKILVVEDNDFVRMQIVRYLSDGGEYDIVEASGGRDALELIDGSFLAAIVDVRMEPVDGFEFIRSLRGLEIEVGVILVTGDQNPDLLNEAGKWGVSAVLIKPVQKDRLVKAVERIVRQKEQAS